jgi:hypothetical protein
LRRLSLRLRVLDASGPSSAVRITKSHFTKSHFTKSHSGPEVSPIVPL